MKPKEPKKSAGRPKKNFWDCLRNKEIYDFCKQFCKQPGREISDYKLAKLMNSSVGIFPDSAQVFLHRCKNAQLAAINPEYLSALAAALATIDNSINFSVPIFAKAHIVLLENGYKRVGPEYIAHALMQNDYIDAVEMISPRDISIDIAEALRIADINFINELEPIIAELLFNDELNRRQLRDIIHGLSIQYSDYTGDGDIWEVKEECRAIMPLIATVWAMYHMPRFNPRYTSPSPCVDTPNRCNPKGWMADQS